MNNKKNKKNGFTLIETMVVVVVFSAIMSLALVIFLGSIRSQRVALAQQKIAMETSYALNRIESDIRKNPEEINNINVNTFNNYLSDDIKIESNDFKKEPSINNKGVTISVKTTLKVDEERHVSYRLQTTVLK